MAVAIGSAILFIALLLCAVRVGVTARRWKRGREAETDLLSGLLALPRRYLHDVHDVVARYPRNARMHAAIAGGFLGSLCGFVLSLAWPGSLPLIGAIAAMTAIAMYGVHVDVTRHRVAAPGLSQGQYAELPWAILTVLLSILAASVAPLLPSVAGQGVFLVAALALLAGLSRLAWMSGNGPMRHAFAGATNLVLHPRPERFNGGRSTDLRLLDLNRSPLGTGRVVEFTFPQLASFDACVQCGRCEQACPAFAAGQPLNPKRFVNDLAEGLRHDRDVHYAGTGHPGLDPNSSGLQRTILEAADGGWTLSPDTIWSCTTCRACVEACPMMIEHVDAMIDLRRSETLQQGRLAPAAQAVLESLSETDTQGGHDLGARFDWAADLRLPMASNDEEAEILLWVGESAYDRRAQKTLRALVGLLRHAGIEPFVLGARELDCGDQARRLGDEATFQDLARRNVATLGGVRFKTLVTADPHALHVLRNEYRALGGTYEVLHHTELLAALLDEGRIAPHARNDARITYHDPCYLGRYNGQYDAPRRILESIGATLTEMERSGRKSHCCGGGGGAPLTDIPGARRIPDMRMEQVAETGATCVAVACPNCTAMLEGVPGTGIVVRDVAELLWEAVERRS